MAIKLPEGMLRVDGTADRMRARELQSAGNEGDDGQLLRSTLQQPIGGGRRRLASRGPPPALVSALTEA